LRQDAFIDERMETHKSTQAACIYLKQLYEMFGDWELALASYNCGPGYVRKAIRMSGNKNDFWGIYPFLPRETRSYVPMFVAVVYVMNTMDEYEIKPDLTEAFAKSDTIVVQQSVSLPLLAKQLDMPAETLQALNPHLKRQFVPQHLKNTIIHIPSEKVDNFLVNRSEIMDSVSKFQPQLPYYARQQSTRVQTPQYVKASILPNFSTEGKMLVTYIVRNGDILDNIALLHKVSVVAIKSWNGLRNNMIIAGQKLSLWIHPESKSVFAKTLVPENKPATSKNTPLPNNLPLVAIHKNVESRNLVNSSATQHTVKSGETLWNIARQYSLTVEQLRKLNPASSQKLSIGQVLKVK
ncbi:MAG: LysM peptidoglycan-binding domain-containing protein, partial [Verrucomicrobia bacterium]|nr:LysM peptidoglycan-binding domain-containing protein [Cytophagales bacterium]